MSAEVIYEIARYAVDANTEALLQRAQIVVENGILHRRVDNGPETVCEETDLHAVIAADPLLNEVRADQVTRIDAEPSAAKALPFLLSVPGSGDDLNESLWSDAMWKEHLEGTDSAERDVYRVLYVNGAPWAAFDTAEGPRMLPEDNSGAGWVGQPLLNTTWGELSFIETGSRTSGTDRTEIGLATDAAVVCFTHPDEEPDVLELYRRGNDADTIVSWLLNGALTSRYDFGWGGDERMPTLAQLFVEASLNGRNGQVIQGSWLAAGVASEDSFGATDTAEWTLRLNLGPDVTDAVLDGLAEHNPKLRDIVTAGRDPDSPAGQARRAALAESLGE